MLSLVNLLVPTKNWSVLNRLTLILSTCVLLSCYGNSFVGPERDDVEVDSVAVYKSHFYDLVVDGYNLRPRKLEFPVSIFMHSSIDSSDVQTITRFKEQIEWLLQHESPEIYFTDHIESASIVMMNGSEELYEEVFGEQRDLPDTWFGGVSTINSQGSCQRFTARLWYRDATETGQPLTDNYRGRLIRHEMGHAFGLKHSKPNSNSVMVSVTRDMAVTLTRAEQVALKLLYYNGPLGEVAKKYTSTGDCYVMTEAELDRLDSLLDDILLGTDLLEF